MLGITMLNKHAEYGSIDHCVQVSFEQAFDYMSKAPMVNSAKHNNDLECYIDKNGDIVTCGGPVGFFASHTDLVKGSWGIPYKRLCWHELPEYKADRSIRVVTLLSVCLEGKLPRIEFCRTGILLRPDTETHNVYCSIICHDDNIEFYVCSEDKKTYKKETFSSFYVAGEIDEKIIKILQGNA